METEWAKMSEADRAEFAAWREQKRAEAAGPKRYEAMSSDEKRRWRQQVGIPVQYGERL